MVCTADDPLFRDTSPSEITERRRKGLIVAAAYLPIARQVGKEYVVDNLAEPRSIGKGKAAGAVPESVFRRVPELRVHIRIRGRAEVAHRASPRIGSDAQSCYARIDRIEFVVLDVIVAGPEERSPQSETTKRRE